MFGSKPTLRLLLHLLLPLGYIIIILVSLHVDVHSKLLHLVWIQVLPLQVLVMFERDVDRLTMLLRYRDEDYKSNVTVWANNYRVRLWNSSPGSSSGREKMVALLIGTSHGRVHITDITPPVSHLCYSDSQMRKRWLTLGWPGGLHF